VAGAQPPGGGGGRLRSTDRRAIDNRPYWATSDTRGRSGCAVTRRQVERSNLLWDALDTARKHLTATEGRLAIRRPYQQARRIQASNHPDKRPGDFDIIFRSRTSIGRPAMHRGGTKASAGTPARAALQRGRWLRLIRSCPIGRPGGADRLPGDSNVGTPGTDEPSCAARAADTGHSSGRIASVSRAPAGQQVMRFGSTLTAEARTARCRSTTH